MAGEIIVVENQIERENHHRILLSVSHLSGGQKVLAGYSHERAKDKNLAREILMDLGREPTGESGFMGGVFFSRVDFDLDKGGAILTIFHAHWKNNKLMVGIIEVEDEYLEFDGVRVSLL